MIVIKRLYMRLYTVLCYFGNKDIKSCQLSFLYLRWQCSPKQARPKNDDHTTTCRKKKFLLRNLPANNGSIFCTMDMRLRKSWWKQFIAAIFVSFFGSRIASMVAVRYVLTISDIVPSEKCE